MNDRVAIIGAGVSGLTCAVVLAERGFRSTILAAEIGSETTSAAAGAIWYPYDTGGDASVMRWALATRDVLLDLSRHAETGVSMIELRSFSRIGEIEMPDWAAPLGARPLHSDEILACFSSGFAIEAPLVYRPVSPLSRKEIRRGGWNCHR